MRITSGTWPTPEEVIARLGLHDGADAVVRQRIDFSSLPVRASPSDPRADVAGWRVWAGLVDDRAFRWRCVVTVSVEELLDGHAALQIDCLDRIYLNA